MDISYTIIRSSRKTISIVIKPTGEVEVRCPRRCSKRHIDAFVVSKEDWIRKHLEAIAQRPQCPMLSLEELQTLAKQAAAELSEKARHFANIVGVSVGRITIRSQKIFGESCEHKFALSSVW